MRWPVALLFASLAMPAGAQTPLIPTMSSNAAPSGVARASSAYGGTFQAWQAFANAQPGTLVAWDAATSTGWLEYEFPTNVLVKYYSIQCFNSTPNFNSAPRCPKSWTVLVDGQVVDIRTNEVDWQVGEQRTYALATPVSG